MFKSALKKYQQLLAVSGLVMASGVSYATSNTTQVIELNKELDDVKLLVSDGGNAQVIKFDTADINSAELDDKLAQLPDDLRSKVNELLENIDAKDGSGVMLLSDSVKMLSNSGESKMVFMSKDDDQHFELPLDPELLDGAELPDNVKVMQFAFGNIKSTEFELAKKFLNNAELTPEQIDEIQTLLNNK